MRVGPAAGFGGSRRSARRGLAFALLTLDRAAAHCHPATISNNPSADPASLPSNPSPGQPPSLSTLTDRSQASRSGTHAPVEPPEIPRSARPSTELAPRPGGAAGSGEAGHRPAGRSPGTPAPPTRRGPRPQRCAPDRDDAKARPRRRQHGRPPAKPRPVAGHWRCGQEGQEGSYAVELPVAA